MAKSFKSEFVKLYKEKLEPYGFKKVKGPQPYFARLVNGEIVHIISYRTSRTNNPGHINFQLCCGIASIYRKRIRFNVTPASNSYCMETMADLMRLRDHYYEISLKNRIFCDVEYTEETMQIVLEKSLIDAKLIIEQLDKYTDMESALKFFMKYNSGTNIIFSEPLSDSFSDEEGLYYLIKDETANLDSIIACQKKDVELVEEDYYKKKYSESLYEYYEDLKTGRQEFLANEELYNEGMKTLQQRKEDNLKMLKEYKVI